MKKILLGKDARNKIANGINMLADTVKTTLGPKGRNCIIEKAHSSPLVTNDGVSIAKEVEYEDIFENMGAQLMKEVATKTNSVAGDGTTTATVLAQAFANSCFELIDQGINPVIIRKEINKIAKEIVTKLEDMAIPVKSISDIEKIGAISSASDEIGALIAKAMEQVGKDGIVTVTEGRGREDELVVVKGMELDRGYLSGYMVTNQDKMTVEYNNGAYVLISSMKLNDISKLITVLETSKERDIPMLLIAEEIGSDLLASIAANNANGTVKCAAIQSPGFGDNKEELLKDIAAFTGATIVDEENIRGHQFELSALGSVGSVNITKEKTVIVNGAGSEERIESRKKQIKDAIANAKNDFEIEQLDNRLANVAGGVAVIKVGATTETEMLERKLRIEDSLNATRAAAEEGILPGGGYALFKIFIEMTKDERSDLECALINPLVAPICQIVENAGGCPEDVTSTMVEKNIGYDALNEEYVDMIEAGIVDPLKVTKNALLSAVSVVSTVITIESAIGVV